MSDLFEEAPLAPEKELEMRLLAAMLHPTGGAVMDVQAVGLQAAMLCAPAHAQVFEHTMRVARRVGAADYDLIVKSMQDDGLDIATLNAIARLAQPSPRVAEWADVIRDRFLSRSVVSMGLGLRERAAAGHPGEMLLSEAREELWRLESLRRGQSPVDMPTEIDAVIAAAEGDAQDAGWGTPWPSVNAVLDGMLPGQMVILGGRPAMGKSAAAVQWGWHLAEQGVPAGFISIEMKRKAVIRRAIAQMGRLPLAELKAGRLTTRHVRPAREARDRLKALPFYVEEMHQDRPTVANVEAIIARWVWQHGVKVVFIDNGQAMTSDERWSGNRAQQLSEVSRRCTSMAQRYNIATVILCQVGRESTNRASKRPTDSDLKETGAWEQDAEQILLLHRPEKFDPEDEAVRGVVEFIVPKNREGETGMVTCTWVAQQTRIADGPPAREVA